MTKTLKGILQSIIVLYLYIIYVTCVRLFMEKSIFINYIIVCKQTRKYLFNYVIYVFKAYYKFQSQYVIHF